MLVEGYVAENQVKPQNSDLLYYVMGNKKLWNKYRIPHKSSTRSPEVAYHCLFCVEKFASSLELQDHVLPAHNREILAKV